MSLQPGISSAGSTKESVKGPASERVPNDPERWVDEHGDVASASLLEVFIDEAEKRAWFLFEASRGADRTGH